ILAAHSWRSPGLRTASALLRYRPRTTQLPSCISTRFQLRRESLGYHEDLGDKKRSPALGRKCNNRDSNALGTHLRLHATRTPPPPPFHRAPPCWHPRHNKHVQTPLHGSQKPSN
ncbi:unnamed protein product, partial [Laminaria digitata]